MPRGRCRRSEIDVAASEVLRNFDPLLCDPAALTADLDANSAALVRRILEYIAAM